MEYLEDLVTIQFDPELSFWSPAVYWYVIVNAVICAIFSLVVVVGGAFDLIYLFKALQQEVVDPEDDGRVIHNR